MALSFAIAKYSLRQFEKYIPVYGLVMDDLKHRRLYYRPTEMRGHHLWDLISDAPMSTEFSISRFLVPFLAKNGMALFCDSDVIFNRSVMRLFELANDGKAVYCVKHDHDPIESIKMDGQIQTRYHRKNWSSVMLFDCDHPSNKKLTIDMINNLPGRDLHRFCWLEDDEIGELSPEWNYLVGQSEYIGPPAIIHFTAGLPDMKGHENQEFADLWLNMRSLAVGAL
jgi:lipopolysaccharide biosynthesis glycosyltransferase